VELVEPTEHFNKKYWAEETNKMEGNERRCFGKSENSCESSAKKGGYNK